MSGRPSTIFPARICQGARIRFPLLFVLVVRKSCLSSPRTCVSRPTDPTDTGTRFYSTERSARRTDPRHKLHNFDSMVAHRDFTSFPRPYTSKTTFPLSVYRLPSRGGSFVARRLLYDHWTGRTRWPAEPLANRSRESIPVGVFDGLSTSLDGVASKVRQCFWSDLPLLFTAFTILFVLLFSYWPLVCRDFNHRRRCFLIEFLFSTISSSKRAVIMTAPHSSRTTDSPGR